MAGKKMGRPRSENPLNVDIKVRIDEETARRLDAYCKEIGKQRAVVIREALVSMLEKAERES